MVFKVLVTDLAIEDLAALVRFISQDNPETARRFGFELLAKLKLLQDHPRLGRVVPERGQSDLRELIHNPYRIVYRVREQQKLVEVLRFWHGARGKIEIGQ